jgi:hypothetical protein
MFHSFLRKSCHLWDNVEKYDKAGQATDVNMAYAFCILDKYVTFTAQCYVHKYISFLVTLFFNVNIFLVALPNNWSLWRSTRIYRLFLHYCFLHSDTETSVSPFLTSISAFLVVIKKTWIIIFQLFKFPRNKLTSSIWTCMYQNAGTAQ